MSFETKMILLEKLTRSIVIHALRIRIAAVRKRWGDDAITEALRDE